jgi:hypothetical protein
MALVVAAKEASLIIPALDEEEQVPALGIHIEHLELGIRTMLDHENLTSPVATPHVQNGRSLLERDFGDTDVSAYTLKLLLD